MTSPLIANAASAMIAAVWQGAILAGCVALCIRLLPGLSSAYRSGIWSAVFCVDCALHFFPVPGDSGNLHSVHAAPQWSVMIAVVWLSCAVFQAIQLALGIRDLHRVFRRAKPIELKVNMPQVSRRYQVCESEDVDRPSVLGFFSPRILLPPGLAESLTRDELNQVLLHEVEHLRRSDDWTNLVQKLALILFPLNPVLLWVDGRLCIERELACDDRVISATGARKAYALCLTRLAERAMLQRVLTLALGAWQQESELARRVHRILSRPARPTNTVALRAIATGVLVAVTAGLITVARSERLISFVPVTTQIARSHQQAVSYGPNAVFANAALRTVNASDAGSGSRRVLATKRLRSRRPVLHSANAHVSRRSLQPRMVLTLSQSESTPSNYFPAVIRMPVAYAAVATTDGWIIIEL